MKTTPYKPDPAAILGCAISLFTCANGVAETQDLDLSEAYQGFDEFMRAVYRFAHRFEAYACENVEDFDAINHCWPYLLEEEFGRVVMEFLRPTELNGQSDAVLAKILQRLRDIDAQLS